MDKQREDNSAPSGTGLKSHAPRGLSCCGTTVENPVVPTLTAPSQPASTRRCWGGAWPSHPDPRAMGWQDANAFDVLGAVVEDRGCDCLRLDPIDTAKMLAEGRRLGVL